MRRCCCEPDYETTRMFYSALADVLTEYYVIFRRYRTFKFLFWTMQHVEEKYVRVPKEYQDNYEEKLMTMKKEMIALTDRGYSTPDITEEVEQRWRDEIGKYHALKNEVWE